MTGDLRECSSLLQRDMRIVIHHLCVHPQAHDCLNEAVISVVLQQDSHIVIVSIYIHWHIICLNEVVISVVLQQDAHIVVVIVMFCLYPQAHDRLNEAVISVNLQQDIHTVITQKGVQGPRQLEQILIDCYVSRQLPMFGFWNADVSIWCDAIHKGM